MSPHAGRRPLSMRATLSWLIWKPFARISAAMALRDSSWAFMATISSPNQQVPQLEGTPQGSIVNGFALRAIGESVG
jgi:hypothetical protein